MSQNIPRDQQQNRNNRHDNGKHHEWYLIMEKYEKMRKKIYDSENITMNGNEKLQFYFKKLENP